MNDEIVKVMLASCIAHLIEYIDTGESLDIVAAAGNLAHADVQEFLSSLDTVMLPVRRDGKPPLAFST